PEPESKPAPTARDEPIDEDQDGVDERLVVAGSSDGGAFGPHQHGVRVLPPGGEGAGWEIGARLQAGDRAALGPAPSRHPRGVDVVRGDFDEGPWLLEALGRDGEYLTFTFETSEAAEAAKQLFERLGIVKLGEDEEGRRMPPSAEQFAEARRIMEQTAAELEL